MNIVLCDCCGDGFEYGEFTAKTDGEYKTVKRGAYNVRVCISVKAHDGEKHIDICPKCRHKVIEEYLGEPVSRH